MFKRRGVKDTPFQKLTTASGFFMNEQKERQMKTYDYKNIKSRVANVIDQLFEQNDRVIPDVKEICSRAKTNRKTALKYLYQWWEKQSATTADSVDWLNCFKTSSEEKTLYGIHTSLEYLIKEVEVYGEALNFLPETTHPLGNHMINSLLEIKDKILAVINSNEETIKLQEHLEHAMGQKQTECERLTREIDGIQAGYSKKLSELREELESSRREATAAKLLVKSLKREKRATLAKNPFYAFKFDT